MEKYWESWSLVYFGREDAGFEDAMVFDAQLSLMSP